MVIPMEIDCDALLPAALKAMDPDPSRREEVKGKLEAYGKAPSEDGG